MNLKDAYNYSVYFLGANGVDEAEFKSLCLVCHLAGIKNNQFELHRGDEVKNKPLADALWRLKSGEPLQYVLGKWDFYESELYVGSGVLIPRPETEELTELAVKNAARLDAPVIYDLCSGSGCIGVSIAKAVPQSEVFCIEKSPCAMAYLEKNAQGVSNVYALTGDVLRPDSFENICKNSIDIIVSNPPYIKSAEIPLLQKELSFEPREALDGGESGLDFYICIINDWKRFLKPGGLLLLEIGEDQGSAVSSLLSGGGYKNISVENDIYGNPRIARAEK